MKSFSTVTTKALVAVTASFAVANASQLNEVDCQNLAEIESDAVVSSPIKLSDTNVEITDQVIQIFPDESEWDANAKLRFGELSRKFALDRLSKPELTEYENLKIQRRKENPSRTFEQIRSDIELHKAVQAAIAGLQQLIDHGTRIFRAET